MNTSKIRAGINVYLLCAVFFITHISKAQVTDTGTNVGIGVSTPSHLLSIGNNTSTTNLFKVDGNHSDVLFNGTHTNGNIWSFINSGSGSGTRFYVEDANNSSGRLTFDFRGNSGAINILAGTSAGNVGIGTTSPLSTLDIRRADANASVLSLQRTDTNANFDFGLAGNDLRIFSPDGSGSNILFGIDNGGVSHNNLVGIGTATPGSGTAPVPNLKLEVNGGISLFAGNSLSLDNNHYNHAYVQYDPTISNSRFKYFGYYGHRFEDSDGVTMVLQRGGNVGIGTTTPSEKLEVDGNIKVSGVTGYTHSDLQFYRADGIKFASIGQGDTNVANSTFDIQHFNGNDIRFLTNNSEHFRIKSSSGNVGIGTANPNGWKLAVNGKIRAKEIKVETGWSDFVFESDYDLPTLNEVEQHIKAKGHLKDIPSAKEVEANGILLGEMDSKLLQKIEELTLYTIDQEKRIKNLETTNKKLLKLLEKLDKTND